MRKFLFFGLIVVGLAGFCAVPFFVGIDKVWSCLDRIGWIGMILFVLISTFSLALPALGWKLLLTEEGHNVPYLSLLKANIMGFPVNFITPSLYLGGEPLKTIFIAQQHDILKRKVLATIIVSKFQELAGLVMLIIGGTTIIIWKSTRLNRTQEILLITATVILAAVLLSVFLAFIGNFKPLVKVLNLLIRLKIFPHKLSELRSKAEEMEHMIHTAFTKRWKIFLVSQFITLFSAVSIFVRPAVFYYYLRTEQPGLSDLSIIYVLTQIVSIFQLIPGNLGIWEGGLVGIFAIIGQPEAEAAAFAIAGRIADLLLLVTGVWLILHYGLTRVAQAKSVSDSNRNTTS